MWRLCPLFKRGMVKSPLGFENRFSASGPEMVKWQASHRDTSSETFNMAELYDCNPEIW